MTIVNVRMTSRCALLLNLHRWDTNPNDITKCRRFFPRKFSAFPKQKFSTTRALPSQPFVPHLYGCLFGVKLFVYLALSNRKMQTKQGENAAACLLTKEKLDRLRAITSALCRLSCTRFSKSVRQCFVPLLCSLGFKCLMNWFSPQNCS